MSDGHDRAVEIGKKIADLQRQINELKAKLSAEKPAFVRKPMPRFDPTEGMRMPPSAAQAMARVVGDVKREPMSADEVRSSWARSRISGPSGFGPPKWEEQKKPQAAQKPAQPPEPKDTRSPQTRMFDAMVDYWAGGPNDTNKLR